MGSGKEEEGKEEKKYPRPSLPFYTLPPIRALIQANFLFLWTEYSCKTSELAVSCRAEH